MSENQRALYISRCPEKRSCGASLWASNCRSQCCEMLEKTSKHPAQKEFQPLTNGKRSEPAKSLTSSREGRGREAKAMFN